MEIECGGDLFLFLAQRLGRIAEALAVFDIGRVEIFRAFLETVRQVAQMAGAFGDDGRRRIRPLNHRRSGLVEVLDAGTDAAFAVAGLAGGEFGGRSDHFRLVGDGRRDQGGLVVERLGHLAQAQAFGPQPLEQGLGAVARIGGRLFQRFGVVMDDFFHGGETRQRAFQRCIDPFDLAGNGAGQGLNFALGIMGRLDQLADGDLDAAGIVSVAQDFACHQPAHDKKQGRGHGKDRQAGQLTETVLGQAFQRVNAQIAPDEGAGGTDPQQGETIAQPDHPVAARIAGAVFGAIGVGARRGECIGLRRCNRCILSLVRHCCLRQFESAVLGRVFHFGARSSATSRHMPAAAGRRKFPLWQRIGGNARR